MYGFIGSTTYFKVVKNFLTVQQEDLIYKITGDNIEIEELSTINNTKVNHLIINLSAIQDLQGLLAWIKEFKQEQSKTQLIIIVPLHISYTDPIIEEFVELGIYDIIRTEIEQDTLEDSLLDVIVHPTPIRKIKGIIENQKNKADKNTNSELENNNIDIEIEQDRPEEQIIDSTDYNKYEEEYQDDYYEDYQDDYEYKSVEPKVIERTVTIIEHKIIGTIVIALAGTQRRIGVTHTSIALAKYLSDMGSKVGIVELHPSKIFSAIKSAYNGLEEGNHCFKLNDISFYEYHKENNLTNILQENFNYLILDMGIFQKCDWDEFHRANKKIIVSGVKDWETIELEKIILDENNKYIDKYNYYFNFSDESTFNFVKNNMGELSCYKSTYIPNYFELSPESNIVFKELLQDILPIENSKKKGRFMSFLKK